MSVTKKDMDKHGPRRKRNPRVSVPNVSRPPLIPSGNLNNTRATATATATTTTRKSIPASILPPIQVTGKQSEKQQLMESIDNDKIPKKNVLQLILDKLQGRDAYDIFAEPVDPNEVEDYYEFIKEPMDFGTMRAKLHEGMYQNLEQFKNDVFLITKNAMHFNSSATIYFRQARGIHEHAKRLFHDLETNPSKFEHTILGTRRRSSTKKARNDTTNGSSINTNIPSNDTSGCSVSKSTLMQSTDQRNKKSLQGRGLNKEDDDNDDDTYDARVSFTHSNTCNPFLGTTDGKKMDNNSKIEESSRRCTYDRRNSPFFQADHSNPFAVNSFKADHSNPFSVNSFKPLVDLSYRESLLSFVKELGPKAKMVAARKLQLLDIRGGSGGAASPGLLLRSYSLPTTTEPPPPPQPIRTTTATTQMGGGSSSGLFLRNYSLPLTTEPPPPPPPLPPTMTTTTRAEMGGAASTGLFLRNYSLPTTTTEPPPPMPPSPPSPQTQPTKTPTRRKEMRGAAGAVHCPNPTEENVRPVILALENPQGNHAFESGKARSKRIGLHTTHNRPSDRGHSQAVVDSGQKQKKPKSSSPSPPPPDTSTSPSFPFDMCFLKAKLDRMIVQGSPVGRRGDNKFATGLQSWTRNPILADQRRFF